MPRRGPPSGGAPTSTGTSGRGLPRPLPAGQVVGCAHRPTRIVDTAPNQASFRCALLRLAVVSRLSPGQSRARLGCTRFGSPGIFASCASVGSAVRQDIPANSWRDGVHRPLGGERLWASPAAPGWQVYLPLNRMVVTGPRPPAATAATWRRYFLPFFTVVLNTRLVVVFQALYFLPPGLEIRTR